MNITEHFHQIALEKVTKKLTSWDKFQEANFSFTITVNKAILSPAIIQLGGRLEHWDCEDGGVYCLAFGSENPTKHCIIGRDGDDMIFLSIIRGEQYILKLTKNEEISIIQLEDLPTDVIKSLEKLVITNIMYAAIELTKK